MLIILFILTTNLWGVSPLPTPHCTHILQKRKLRLRERKRTISYSHGWNAHLTKSRELLFSSQRMHFSPRNCFSQGEGGMVGKQGGFWGAGIFSQGWPLSGLHRETSETSCQRGGCGPRFPLLGSTRVKGRWPMGLCWSSRSQGTWARGGRVFPCN